MFCDFYSYSYSRQQFESKTEQDFELMEEGVTHQDQLTAHMVQLQKSVLINTCFN